MKKKINRDDYPMVVSWDNYTRTISKVLCKCDFCGSEFLRTFYLLKPGETTYCMKCRGQKRKENCIKKHGVEHQSQLPHVREKIRKAMLSEETQAKMKTVIQKKYGVDYYFQLEEFKEELFKKNIEKYGNKCSLHGKEIEEKVKKGWKEKYGTDYPNQSEVIKNKIKETNIEKYGYENPSYSPLIKNKIRNKYINKTDEQKSEIESKRKNTNINLYDVPFFAQINRSMESVEITSSKENLESYLKTFAVKPTIEELSEKLEFVEKHSSGTYIRKWGLHKYIDYYRSFGEKGLGQYISSLGFIIEKRKFQWGEIDILINEKNIGFEYNGCFWHSNKRLDKDYHYRKTTNAENEGIRLIHIWEHEWINDNEHIKAYIKAQLGLCDKRVFARKCEIREIKFSEAKPLLNYHQQKAIGAMKYIGLYNKNELVLVMLFTKVSKNIFTKNPIAEWEIKREVCKEGYSVIGGKSKVFNYFVKTYSPKSVVSYVDRSKFTGNSYKIMGFKLDHINPSRYDWVEMRTLIFTKRQPQIYRKMKELYDQNKVLKIYDAGRYCYLWKPVT
jgi:hypothetical protein